jgi:hypothetical protein
LCQVIENTLIEFGIAPITQTFISRFSVSKRIHVTVWVVFELLDNCNGRCAKLYRSQQDAKSQQSTKKGESLNSPSFSLESTLLHQHHFAGLHKVAGLQPIEIDTA